MHESFLQEKPSCQLMNNSERTYLFTTRTPTVLRKVVQEKWFAPRIVAALENSSKVLLTRRVKIRPAIVGEVLKTKVTSLAA